MLFRGERANQESCHVCGTSRWVTDDKKRSPTEPKKKKKPAKVLRYFLLIPRIQRLFVTNKTSDDMRWHDEGRTKDGLLRHPADGQSWKDLDVRYLEFSADARNVRLGLASDGFNPFRNMSSKHSTWPVMFIPYNLPPWICMKQTSLMKDGMWWWVSGHMIFFIRVQNNHQMKQIRHMPLCCSILTGFLSFMMENPAPAPSPAVQQAAVIPNNRGKPAVEAGGKKKQKKRVPFWLMLVQ